MATLECFPPKLGVTIMVYCVSLTLVNEPAIDHDGTGSLNGLVNITLKNIAYRVDLLTGLIANGNLVCHL
jgi:hypothetical protein